MFQNVFLEHKKVTIVNQIVYAIDVAVCIMNRWIRGRVVYMKKATKVFSGFLLGTVVVSQVMTPMGAFAKEDEKTDNKKEKKTKGFSEQIKKKRGELLNLDKDIMDLEQEMKDLNKALKKEDDLKKKEIEVKEKEELLKKRWDGYTDKIAAWQVEGTPEENFLDVLFGAESLSDMISRAYTFKTLMTAEQEQIKLLKEETADLITEKEELQREIDELKRQKKEAVKKEKELESKRSKMKKELKKLQKDEKERIEKELKRQEELKKELLAKQVKLEKLKELRELTKAAKETEEKVDLETDMREMKIAETVGSHFITPTEGRLTSPYGVRPNPFGGSGTEFHTGIDLANVSGTPIMATAGGEVIQVVSSNAGYGNYVVLKHEIDGKTFHSLYAHLSLAGVQEGEIVEQGEVIGLMGTTGRSTGSHLHFEIQDENRKHMNPKNFLDKKDDKKVEKKEIKEKKTNKKDKKEKAVK